MYFSIIVPVYNRPDEIKAFLESLILQDYLNDFEIIIIEDGSELSCEYIVKDFNKKLNISYFFKKNSGPGDSRNFGMKRAKGNYFLIFDSDCELPKQYLSVVNKSLENNFVDCYGGPDAALDNYSDIQKSINFAMTSFLTTGGIRGSSERLNKFQPRSFNMGISKNAFLKTNGFGKIHPGEDPDLSIRLWKLGFTTKLIKDAFVYHKRRIDWKKYYSQVNKFGLARPVLDSWHPAYSKFIFAIPSLFLVGFCMSIFLYFFKLQFLLYLYFLYFFIVFAFSIFKYKSIKIGFLSIFAVAIQFYGYGCGYLKSFFLINILKIKPENALPKLFFK